MNLMDLLDRFPRDGFALVLRSVLDRIPVIIGGHDSGFVDQVLMKIVDIFPIRKEIIYATDFLAAEEYESIVHEENMDYDNHKIIVRAPVNSESDILKRMASIKGWVIGTCMNGDPDCFYEVASQLRRKATASTFVMFDEANQLASSRYFENGAVKKLDTSLERTFLSRTLSQTSFAIEKIKRVLDKKMTKADDVNQSILDSLVDLSQEEDIIKENMLKREIIEFYQASRRGLALLTRLNFLNQFQPVKIGKKSFFDAVSYNDASTERFLAFVRAEWGEMFDGLIDTSMISVLGDHLDGMWG